MYSLTFRVRVMLPCNAIRAPIANPSNSAQLGASPTTPPSYIRVPATLWACGRGQTDRHTDARDHNTFPVVYATHAKCNKLKYQALFSAVPNQCMIRRHDNKNICSKLLLLHSCSAADARPQSRPISRRSTLRL